MKFKIIFSEPAIEQMRALEKNKSEIKNWKAVRKTLGLMETNLRHPSLNTHEFGSKKGPGGEKIFESYAQNHTPGAYRIFWYYGPKKKEINVLALLHHP